MNTLLLMACACIAGCAEMDVGCACCQTPETFVTEGNGWVVLSNAIDRAMTEDGVDGEALMRLDWYVHADQGPSEDAAFYRSDCGPEFLLNFTNRTMACACVEACLSSNAWILAALEEAASAPVFVAAPGCTLTSDDGWLGDGFWCLNTTVKARIKCSQDEGDPDEAVTWMHRYLDLALNLYACDVKSGGTLAAGLPQVVRALMHMREATVPRQDWCFPLVVTNGCFFTRDLRHVVAAVGGNEPVVVGGDAQVFDVNFEQTRSLVVPPDCTNCLGNIDQHCWDRKTTWIEAFTDPVALQSVTVAPDNPEIGVAGDSVYHKSTGRLLNFLGAKTRVEVPPQVRELSDFPLYHLQNAKELHFSGNLPSFVHVSRKRNRGALAATSADLVVTVSRKNADARTRKIVESGTWEGRPIRWSDAAHEEK